jgi:hypothetical protein
MKNTAWAYILWIVGLHGFYFDKPNASFGVWFSLVASIVLIPFTLGFSILLFLFIWFADLLLIPTWVKEANEKEAQVQSDLIAQGIRKSRGEDAINN